ncbi:hypothetical protein Thi970DRAFT_03155 [Thiorhodovibrio frisius]|uniref:Uncharacterized protein n=1 Tax=Thiorhodovibrio frisius TaxID=631362 RepID=H8Z5U1_9GAMM|nr:hypothetical protein Thi970DRAFT_03155 [Thiorhodovibrio frisius]
MLEVAGTMSLIVPNAQGINPIGFRGYLRNVVAGFLP